MIFNIGKLVRGKKVGNPACDSFKPIDPKDKTEDIVDNGWITRTFGDTAVSNLLGHHYRTSSVCISPSGRYVAIIRYRPVYTIRQLTKLTLRMNDDTQPAFKNQIFILDLADLSLKRHRVNDGSTLQKINYFCWLDDSSLMTVTRTLSSFVQKQYSVDHDTKTLIVSNTYESKVDGLQPVVDRHRLFRRFQQLEVLRSLDIQGIKFSVVSSQTEKANQMWLLPHKLNEYGPRYPPIYVRFNEYECKYEGGKLISNPGSFFTHGSKIYLHAERWKQKELCWSISHPHDVHFCCDLADINITSPEMNFINTANEVPKVGVKSNPVRPYPARSQCENIVTIREFREKQEMILWIWNMEEETFKEHTIRTADDFDRCFSHKSLIFALRRTKFFPSKTERNMLNFKILPRGTESTLADLSRRRILSNPELFEKDTRSMNAILFK